MQLLREEVLVFIEVVRTGSMSAAGEALNLGQPAISKAIKKLEAESGERLLSRGREGSRATMAGRRLFEKISSLQKVNGAGERFSPSALTIGCHPSLAMDVFPQVLPKLRRLLPETQWNFSFAPSTEITSRVANGEVDIGFVINPIKRRQLVSRSLKKDFVALWGSEEVEQSPILIHPDMLYAPHVKKQFRKEIWTMADYEVIAELCRHRYQGLLPALVALRHGLPQRSKKLFEVELKLITHEDRFDKAFLRQMYSLLE